MIKEFVEAWEANKDKLEDYFRNTEQGAYDEYLKIVEKLFEKVINPYYENNTDYPMNEIRF